MCFSGLKVASRLPYVGPDIADYTTILNLKVTSVNTHDPQFTQSVYSVAVQESLETSADILT